MSDPFVETVYDTVSDSEGNVISETPRERTREFDADRLDEIRDDLALFVQRQRNEQNITDAMRDAAIVRICEALRIFYRELRG